jgi:hypothetical protein
MNVIYHLLYISEQSRLFSDSDVERILNISSVNNHELALTGILIKNGNFFIQLLEGKQETVNQLYQKISLDPRHTRIKTLMTFSDSTRMFPQWSMGYVEGTKDNLKLTELIPLIHEEVMKKEDTKSRIISVLRKFNHQ